MNSLSDFTSVADVPPSNVYTNQFYRYLPFDSDYLIGNNLSVSISPNPNNIFNLRFVNEINVTFKQNSKTPANAGNIETWWLGYTYGINVDKDSNLVSYFSCIPDMATTSASCTVSQTITHQIKPKHSIVYATFSDFNPEQGVVLVTSDGSTESDLVFLGVQFPGDNFVKTLPVGASKGRVFFKIAIRLYSFFFLQDTSVLVYQAWNKQITAMDSLPRMIIQAGDDEILPVGALFCPISILQCPLNESIIHIESRCNQTNQRYSFTSTYDQGITLANTSQFNLNELGGNTPQND